MKQDFHEGLRSSNRDRIDARDQDFDWPGLYRRLSEDAHAEGNDRDLAGVVTGLLQMLVPYREGRIRPTTLGFRLIALAWVLDPDYFPGSPSLTELARRANITPAKLARYTGHYSRLLRWRNRGQQHAWNWRKGQRSRSSDGATSTQQTAVNQRPASKRESVSGEEPKGVTPSTRR